MCFCVAVWCVDMLLMCWCVDSIPPSVGWTLLAKIWNLRIRKLTVNPNSFVKSSRFCGTHNDMLCNWSFRLVVLLKIFLMCVFMIRKDKPSYLQRRIIVETALLMAKSINHLHRNGYVHRNIATANFSLQLDDSCVCQLSSVHFAQKSSQVL